MKTFGRISLFILCGILCFVGGAYVNSLYTKWFYPNRYEQQQEFQEYANQQKPTLPQTTQESPKEPSVLEEPVAVAASDADSTDCDTVFVVMKYDMQQRTTVQEESTIPAKYMGMSRDQLQEAIQLYVAAPPLSELNQGFVTAELVSFSPQKVVVKKSYQQQETADQFILLAEGNYVTVYRNDLETVYLYTDIRVDELPVEVQHEIIHQKYMDSEEELYNFLESYSS